MKINEIKVNNLAIHKDFDEFLGKSVKSSIMYKFYDSLVIPLDNGVGHVVAKSIYRNAVTLIENIVYDNVNVIIRQEIGDKIIK